MNNLSNREFYPHTSDIIDIFTYRSYATTPINQLVQGSVRGILVHDNCISYAKGEKISQLSETYQPYLNAFISWFNGNQAVLIKANERLYDDEHEFTGELDLILKLNGSKKNSPLEIKTGSKFLKSWILQLASYDHLCEVNGYDMEVSYILHLKKIYKKGRTLVRPEAIPFTKAELKQYWEIFRSSLSCYDFYYREEYRKKMMEELSA